MWKRWLRVHTIAAACSLAALSQEPITFGGCWNFQWLKSTRKTIFHAKMKWDRWPMFAYRFRITIRWVWFALFNTRKSYRIVRLDIDHTYAMNAFVRIETLSALSCLWFYWEILNLFVNIFTIINIQILNNILFFTVISICTYCVKFILPISCYNDLWYVTL